MPIIKFKQLKTRTPLKERPLRHAGQSVQEMLDDKLLDAMGLIFGACLLAIFAALEWWRSTHHDTFHPYLYTFIAFGSICYSATKLRSARREIRSLKLGRDGERIVSEFLEQMRELGYEILHDLVAGNFNVDHVLIGPTGVYAIETKTRSKSGGVEEKILYDGTNVIIHGYMVEPNPVNQAKANARWVKELLKSSTGKDFPVTPVVLYPGWYVERNSNATDALVLNPKNLEPTLKNRRVVLPSTDVSLAALHLKIFIRSKKKGRL